jgi:hypothetical protein
VTKRYGKREANVSLRISAALTEFLQIVDSEASKIQASASSSPETVASQAQEPLQNILKAAQQALANVKNCEYAPSPSGAYQTPPSSVSNMVLAKGTQTPWKLNLPLVITAVSITLGYHPIAQEGFIQLTGCHECIPGPYQLRW